MEFEPRLGIYRESMDDNPLLMKVQWFLRCSVILCETRIIV